MTESSLRNTWDAQTSREVSTKQRRIAELARKYPERVFCSLNHYLDLNWLLAAYIRTRKDGAPGVDGVTARQYEQNLQANLSCLLLRMKSGTYRAPPVRRVYIPKGSGGQRPLGIPTLEDKVAQRAMVMLLEPIFEQDFLACSYGFRPGRSAHQALEQLRNDIMDRGGQWVIDLDISNYFGTIEHAQLRCILDKRVKDGVVRRLIDKWLKAGVFEDGMVKRSTGGTPQGGVISPLLANVFLHHVLDDWFHQQAKPRLRGSSSMVRYADDVVAVFQNKEDCDKLRNVLAKRLAKYGLTLHPDKTRVVDFRATRERDKRPAEHHHGSFNFLGFTHYWRQSRRGYWVVLRKTAKDRLAASLKKVSLVCRRNRHESLPVQQKRLCLMMKGHYGYFGITGNSHALRKYAHTVGRIWFRWLSRRSGRKGLTWERFNRLLKRHPLPPPHIVHSYYQAP